MAVNKHTVYGELKKVDIKSLNDGTLQTWKRIQIGFERQFNQYGRSKNDYIKSGLRNIVGTVYKYKI